MLFSVRIVRFLSFFFNQKGDTPLHIAIRGRSRKLAELLLRNPKDGRLLYRPNKTGETPYNIDCTHQKSILTQIFGASMTNFSFNSGIMLHSHGLQQALDDRRQGETSGLAWETTNSLIERQERVHGHVTMVMFK